MTKSRLHTAATTDPGSDIWRSLPPHVPGACYGQHGDPCPSPPREPCQHAHRTSGAAMTCSRNRPPFTRER